MSGFQETDSMHLFLVSEGCLLNKAKKFGPVEKYAFGMFWQAYCMSFCLKSTEDIPRWMKY